VRNVDRAGRLFDALAETPDGLSLDQIIGTLKVPQRTAEQVLRVLRLLLGEGDDLFVVCDRDDDGIYRYRLMSAKAVVDAEWSQWTGTRTVDLESRLILFIAASKAAVAATDGRSKEGKIARIMERYMLRLAEDLAELDGRLFP